MDHTPSSAVEHPEAMSIAEKPEPRASRPSLLRLKTQAEAKVTEATSTYTLHNTLSTALTLPSASIYRRSPLQVYQNSHRVSPSTHPSYQKIPASNIKQRHCSFTARETKSSEVFVLPSPSLSTR